MLSALKKMDAVLADAESAGLDTEMLREIELQALELPGIGRRHEPRTSDEIASLMGRVADACDRVRDTGAVVYLCDLNLPVDPAPTMKEVLADPYLAAVCKMVYGRGFYVSEIGVRSRDNETLPPDFGDVLPARIPGAADVYCLIARRQRPPIRSF